MTEPVIIYEGECPFCAGFARLHRRTYFGATIIVI